MKEKDIKTIRTTRGTLQYYRDWENCDGGIHMLNDKTVDRYRELKQERPNDNEFGIFFAFGQEQFDRGLAGRIASGHIKKGEKIMHWGAGLYGTKEEIDRYFRWFDEVDLRIKAECDPQEIYFYEYNNHESQISWDGDEMAIKTIARIWGLEVAHTIKRYSEFYDLPQPKVQTV